LLLAATKEEATEGADALVICTEWKRFMAPNFDQLATALRQKPIFDGRNLYDLERLAELGWLVPAVRGLWAQGRAHHRRWAGKPAKARRPYAAVQVHCEVIGAGAGSLR
jgi:UDPglucose 6-dehydrogenase